MVACAYHFELSVGKIAPLLVMEAYGGRGVLCARVLVCSCVGVFCVGVLVCWCAEELGGQLHSLEDLTLGKSPPPVPKA